MRILRRPNAALLLVFLATSISDAFIQKSPLLMLKKWPLEREFSCFAEKSTSSTIEATSTETSTASEVKKNALRGLLSCTSATQARRILQAELSGDNSLYQSISIPPGASVRGISDGDLAIQTRLANKKYKIMDLIELSGDRDADRASLAVLGLMIACPATAVVVNQNLPGPEILRFLVVWLLSFAPLAFVGYGIVDAEKLQGALLNIQRNVFPSYRRRMLQHESGHFLIAHLLGWPIAGYRANAIKSAVEFYPFADIEKGKDYARQLGFDSPKENAGDDIISVIGDSNVPFFSKGGRGGSDVEERSVFRQNKNYTEFLQLSSQNEPSEAWPYRGFDESTLDQLAVISVAGVCAEIISFGNAEGGAADLNQLRQLFNSAEDEMTDRDINNRIRYALGYTMSQLRRHLGALDALADAMERNSSVDECVLAIESCKNPSGQDGIMVDYELRRRQAFKTEGASWIERVFLGGERDIDTVEDRMIEGRGGGSRKEEFRLTGDDPLYLALAASFSFFVWASLGGL